MRINDVRGHGPCRCITIKMKMTGKQKNTPTTGTSDKKNNFSTLIFLLILIVNAFLIWQCVNSILPVIINLFLSQSKLEHLNKSVSLWAALSMMFMYLSVNQKGIKETYSSHFRFMISFWVTPTTCWHALVLKKDISCLILYSSSVLCSPCLFWISSWLWLVSSNSPEPALQPTTEQLCQNKFWYGKLAARHNLCKSVTRWCVGCHKVTELKEELLMRHSVAFFVWVTSFCWYKITLINHWRKG